MRRGIAITAGLGAVLLVAGCTPKFNGDIKGKQISDNKVQIKFKICIRDSGDPGECAPAARQARRGEPLYHLLAFRVPKGSGVPDSFTTRDGAVSYDKNGSYGRELTSLAPTPGETKWYGYVSDKILGDAPTRARYKLKFGLPNDPGDVFKHRPVTGWGISGDKIDCGDSAFDPSKESGANTVCISDPTKRRKVRKSLKIELD